MVTVMLLVAQSCKFDLPYSYANSEVTGSPDL